MSGPRISLSAGRPRITLFRTDPTNPNVVQSPAQGPKGNQGKTGDTGPPGLQGQQGIQGERGIPGDTTLKILDMSAQAISRTGSTAEGTLKSITIPANWMGIDGGVRLTAYFSMPSSANNKTFRVRFSGAAGTIFASEVYTTSVTAKLVVEIKNRGAKNTQLGGPIDLHFTGASSSAIIATAVDTSVDTTLVITGQLANSGETIKLESYMVELMQPPAQAATGIYFGGDGIILNNVTGEVKVDRTNVPTINSPSFTGSPQSTTPSSADNTNRIATTAYVQTNLAGLSSLYLTSNVATARTLLGIQALGLLATVDWSVISSSLKATAANFRTGADQVFLTPKNIYDANAFVSLTDAATIAVDLNAGINFAVTITTNRTLGFPTNPKVGQGGYIDVAQPAAGAKLLDFAAGYTFEQGVKPTLDGGANRVTSLYYFVKTTGEVRIATAFKGVRATP